MSELEVQGLVKHIDGKLVIDHVSFAVEDNEFFVLLGPSESGKTTLLRLLCGMDQAEEGYIFLHGKDVTDPEKSIRNVATVFQEQSLLPHMNVYDNIAYGVRYRRITRQELETRVNTAVELLGLRELLKRPVTHLSGGELQRVALGRAMVKDANLYLFDEPISQLDPATRHRIQQEIVLVHRIKRKPSIYITQDRYEAFNMGNRIAVMANGRIQQIGTPDLLLHAPANLFVAQFLQDSPVNMLDGYVERSDMRFYLRANGFAFAFPRRWTPSLLRLEEQKKVLLLLRPESIIPEWSLNTLQFVPHIVLNTQILSVGPVMSKRIVRLRTEQGLDLTAEFRDTSSLNLQPGTILKVGINPEQILFFHPQTEELLNPLQRS